MAGVKKELCDLQGPGVVSYVLEQLAEVATVKNEHGEDEELFILYPPKKPEVTEESGKSSEKTAVLYKRNVLVKSSDNAESLKSEDANKITEERENGVNGDSSKTQGKTTEDPASPQGTSRKRGRPSKTSGNNEAGFECSNCHKVFSLKGNLKVHMKIHSGDKPFVCTQEGCEKTFRSKDALKKHLNSHSGDKQWKCSSCEKGFSSKVALVEHEARHSNTKAYKCGVCDMEFRQYSCMSRHLLTHKEEFRYSCSVCQKKFKMAIYLKSHMRVHTGETPYECSTCQKKFKHQSDLIRHKIIHSGTKPFECKVCGVRFSDNSCRRRHEREHLTKSTFKCKLCKLSFKKIEKLKSHMISTHFSQQDLTANQSEITSLLKELDQVAEQEAAQNPSDLLQQKLTQEKPISTPITLAPVGNVLEKRMITHHVSVPRVQGQPVVIDPYSLLEHIKDQLDPSQMPQTINGEALQVCHKIIQDNKDHVIVELQYLSTVQVTTPELAPSVAVDKTQVKCQDLLPGTVGGSSLLGPQQQESVGVSDLSELSAHSGFITSVAVESVSNDIENLGAYIDISQMEEREEALKLDEEDAMKVPQRVKDEKRGTLVPQIEVQPQCRVAEILDNPLTLSFVKESDFSEQYFEWLQEFCQSCKGLNVPMEQNIFETISTVNKKLADVLASPKGIMADKTKFVTCLRVSKELSAIIESHHNYVLNCFNQNKLLP